MTDTLMTAVELIQNLDWKTIAAVAGAIGALSPLVVAIFRGVFRLGQIVTILNAVLQQMSRTQLIHAAALESQREALVEHGKRLKDHDKRLDDHEPRILSLEKFRSELNKPA